jgi:hypothetical protein
VGRGPIGTSGASDALSVSCSRAALFIAAYLPRLAQWVTYRRRNTKSRNASAASIAGINSGVARCSFVAQHPMARYAEIGSIQSVWHDTQTRGSDSPYADLSDSPAATKSNDTAPITLLGRRPESAEVPRVFVGYREWSRVVSNTATLDLVVYDRAFER